MKAQQVATDYQRNWTLESDTPDWAWGSLAILHGTQDSPEYFTGRKGSGWLKTGSSLSSINKLNWLESLGRCLHVSDQSSSPIHIFTQSYSTLPHRWLKSCHWALSHQWYTFNSTMRFFFSIMQPKARLPQYGSDNRHLRTGGWVLVKLKNELVNCHSYSISNRRIEILIP